VADPLYWDDAYPIALMLKRAHPDTGPLTVASEVLHGWVVALEGFADDPDAHSPDFLEQIRAEWVEIEN
jgi:FeS assembly protein IscX